MRTLERGEGIGPPASERCAIISSREPYGSTIVSTSGEPTEHGTLLLCPRSEHDCIENRKDHANGWKEMAASPWMPRAHFSRIRTISSQSRCQITRSRAKPIASPIGSSSPDGGQEVVARPDLPKEAADTWGEIYNRPNCKLSTFLTDQPDNTAAKLLHLQIFQREFGGLYVCQAQLSLGRQQFARGHVIARRVDGFHRA